VEFTVEAYPGEVFDGKVSFIDPILHEKTRTVKVRLNIENPDGRLKPGMFVRATVKSKLSEDGRIVADYLKGKWISPMHPEVIKDGPGKCDVCGMPLVRAEMLGFAGSEESAVPPLVIPASAPLITGKRAIVYLKLTEKEKPTFIGREVVLGSRAGDYYIVKSGLKEGEEVVVSGNFKIDSALQIEAKPSMMSREGGGTGGGHHHGAGPGKVTSLGEKSPMAVNSPETFKKQLADVFNRYLVLQESLAGDDFNKAHTSLTKLNSSVLGIKGDTIKLPHDARWKKEHENMLRSMKIMEKAKKIEELREGFSQFSETLSESMKTFGVSSETPVYLLHCPMAFDNRGANWLQNNQDTQNPYFGSAMLKCGGVVSAISGSESDKE